MKVCNMSQILKLQDTDGQFRQVVESVRQKKEECVVQDEQGRSVAAVVPIELYRLYQQEWEKGFAAVDRIREKMKGYDPAQVEAQIKEVCKDEDTSYSDR